MFYFPFVPCSSHGSLSLTQVYDNANYNGQMSENLNNPFITSDMPSLMSKYNLARPTEPEFESHEWDESSVVVSLGLFCGCRSLIVCLFGWRLRRSRKLKQVPN